MPRVITSLCLREGGCVTVCPVDCIIPGKPEDKYPWYYIDPDTCIDCGACEAECPLAPSFLTWNSRLHTKPKAAKSFQCP